MWKEYALAAVVDRAKQGGHVVRVVGDMVDGDALERNLNVTVAPVARLEDLDLERLGEHGEPAFVHAEAPVPGHYTGAAVREPLAEVWLDLRVAVSAALRDYVGEDGVEVCEMARFVCLGGWPDSAFVGAPSGLRWLCGCPETPSSSLNQCSSGAYKLVSV